MQIYLVLALGYEESFFPCWVFAFVLFTSSRTAWMENFPFEASDARCWCRSVTNRVADEFSAWKNNHVDVIDSIRMKATNIFTLLADKRYEYIWRYRGWRVSWYRVTSKYTRSEFNWKYPFETTSSRSVIRRGTDIWGKAESSTKRV